jgi:hypothetical protein
MKEVARRMLEFLKKSIAAIFPGEPHGGGDRTPPQYSRLAVPYTFNPQFGLRSALVAIAGCLTRIFGGCVLFALWGGASVAAWSAIANHVWRVVAVVSLLLVFLTGLVALMAGISAAERQLAPKL